MLSSKVISFLNMFIWASLKNKILNNDFTILLKNFRVWTLLKMVLLRHSKQPMWGIPTCCLWQSFPLEEFLVNISLRAVGPGLKEGPTIPCAQWGHLALPHLDSSHLQGGSSSSRCCSSCWGGEGKVKSCLTNLVTFCAEMAAPGAEGRAVVMSASVSCSAGFGWAGRAGAKPGWRTGFRVQVVSGTSLMLGVVLGPGSTLRTFADGETWLVLQRGVLHPEGSYQAAERDWQEPPEGSARGSAMSCISGSFPSPGYVEATHPWGSVGERIQEFTVSQQMCKQLSAVFQCCPGLP